MAVLKFYTHKILVMSWQPLNDSNIHDQMIFHKHHSYEVTKVIKVVQMMAIQFQAYITTQQMHKNIQLIVNCCKY